MPVPERIPPSLAAEWILLCDKEALTQDVLRLKRGKNCPSFPMAERNDRAVTGESGVWSQQSSGRINPVEAAWFFQLILGVSAPGSHRRYKGNCREAQDRVVKTAGRRGTSLEEGREVRKLPTFHLRFVSLKTDIS